MQIAELIDSIARLSLSLCIFLLATEIPQFGSVTHFRDSRASRGGLQYLFHVEWLFFVPLADIIRLWSEIRSRNEVITWRIVYLANRVDKVHWRRGRRSIARVRKSQSIDVCDSYRKASGNSGTSHSAAPTAAAAVIADCCRRSSRCCYRSNCYSMEDDRFDGIQTTWPKMNAGSSCSICFQCCWTIETALLSMIRWLFDKFHALLANWISIRSTSALNYRNLFITKTNRKQN